MNEPLSDIYYQKGLALSMNGNLSQALKQVKLALAIHPEHVDAKQLEALCHYRLGFYGHLPSSYLNDATLQSKHSKLQEVIDLAKARQHKKALKKLEQMEDKSVNEWNMLGCLYAHFKKKDKALASFSHALTLDQGNPDSLYFLRHAYEWLKRRWFA